LECMSSCCCVHSAPMRASCWSCRCEGLCRSACGSPGFKCYPISAFKTISIAALRVLGVYVVYLKPQELATSGAALPPLQLLPLAFGNALHARSRSGDQACA
jgi:hypothetical protein